MRQKGDGMIIKWRSVEEVIIHRKFGRKTTIIYEDDLSGEYFAVNRKEEKVVR